MPSDGLRFLLGLSVPLLVGGGWLPFSGQIGSQRLFTATLIGVKKNYLKFRKRSVQFVLSKSFLGIVQAAYLRIFSYLRECTFV